MKAFMKVWDEQQFKLINMSTNVRLGEEQMAKYDEKIEKEIANTQALLKKTEKNQKASLQQIAVLRQQISSREKLITALNEEILQMEQQQELNQQMILSLQKKLEYMMI